MIIEATILSTNVSVLGNKIVFSPTHLSFLGTHPIKVTLTDQVGLNTTLIFNCSVVYPNFMQNISLLASNNYSYNLLAATGNPGESVIHSIVLPRFVNFTFPTYTFFPN